MLRGGLLLAARLGAQRNFPQEERCDQRQNQYRAGVEEDLVQGCRQAAPKGTKDLIKEGGPLRPTRERCRGTPGGNGAWIEDRLRVAGSAGRKAADLRLQRHTRRLDDAVPITVPAQASITRIPGLPSTMT